MTDNDNDNVYIMKTGVRIRLLEFNPATLGEAEKQIEDATDRTNAFMDIIAAMTIELADGLPEDDRWLKDLRLLEKIGRIDLSKFDLDDEVDLEFLFKKHKALSIQDWMRLFRLLGIDEKTIDGLNELLDETE